MTNKKQIIRAFNWTAVNRPKYLADIERRPAGSQWGRGGYMNWMDLAFLPWCQLPRGRYIQGMHLDSCDYFFLQSYPFEGATQVIKLLSDFGVKECKSIELREGSHGLELVSPLVRPTLTNEAWLILGQARYENKEIAEGEQMVWSAYPGPLTASIKHVDGFDGTLDSLIKAADRGIAIAVKGLNQ